MPPHRSEFDRELQALEVEVKRLEAKYNMFFAGRLPRLPWEQRARVDQLMKRYDRIHIQNTGERFRFQTIQARWAAFGELWERQLKAQEQGRVRPMGARRPSAAAPPPLPPRPDSASAAPKKEWTLSDPGAQEDRVRALYAELSDARRQAGEKPVEFDRFSELVQAQVKKLGGEGRDVAFRVTVKNGRVTLSANSSDDS